MRTSSTSARHALLALALATSVAVFGACERQVGLVDNPVCFDSLVVLALDDGGHAAGDAATSTLLAPCDGGAVTDPGGGGDDLDDDAGSTSPPVTCATYFCICADTTTQSGSAADPVTGSCDVENQTCDTLCTAHGGWM
jgi:hypothetical protein